jgi:hypothetical protein
LHSNKYLKVLWRIVALAAIVALVGCTQSAQEQPTPMTASIASQPTSLAVPSSATGTTNDTGAGQHLTPAVPAAATASGLPGAPGPSGTFLELTMSGGIVKTGEKQTVSVIVDDADNVTFYLIAFGDAATQGQSGAAGTKLAFSVRGPNGETASTEAPTQYGYCFPGGFPGMGGYMCSIDKPSAGRWQATVEAKQAPDKGTAFFVQPHFTGGVQIVPQLSKKAVGPGEPVELKASIQDPAPVTGATVEAWITTMPMTSGATGTYTGTVQLVEQGGGVYTAEFTPSSAGAYDIGFHAKGRNSRGHDFVRQETSLLDVGNSMRK